MSSHNPQKPAAQRVGFAAAVDTTTGKVHVSLALPLNAIHACGDRVHATIFAGAPERLRDVAAQLVAVADSADAMTACPRDPAQSSIAPIVVHPAAPN